MGMDKCTVLFCGKPLIYWPYHSLIDIVDEMVLSISSDRDVTPFQNLFDKEYVLARDEEPDLGPILGILSSFKKAKGEYVALAPCDSPLIIKELYIRLFDLSMGCDGAVPKVNGYWEPLHGVYRREPMISAIGKALSEGKSRPIDAYNYLDIRELSEDKIREFDPEFVSFLNINSFEQLLNVSNIRIKSKTKDYY